MSLPENVVVRARTERDVSEVVSWVRDPRALYLFSGRRLQWPLTEEQLREVGQVEGLTPWIVARMTGETIGHFDITQVEAEAHLGRLIVPSAMRGRGLGRTLLRSALSQARKMGAESVRLNVISDNEPAIRIYVGAGFSIVSDAGDCSDVIVMSKRLI